MNQEKLKAELGAVISAPEIVDDTLEMISEAAKEKKPVDELVEEVTRVLYQQHPDVFKKFKNKRVDMLRQLVKEGITSQKTEPSDDRAPETETANPSETDNETDKAQPKAPAEIMIKVYLKPEIVRRGARLADPDTKKWIKGTEDEPELVKLTSFVSQKLATKELIEVRD